VQRSPDRPTGRDPKNFSQILIISFRELQEINEVGGHNKLLLVRSCASAQKGALKRNYEPIGATSMEVMAARMVSYLYEKFVLPDGSPACAFVFDVY